jgi:hypothetical protein
MERHSTVQEKAIHLRTFATKKSKLLNAKYQKKVAQ